MATKVNFYIRGLCLCFLKAPKGKKEKYWHVLFICDDVHKLSMNGPGLSEPIFLHDGPGVEGQLELDGVPFVKKQSGFGKNFERIFNLSWDDIHGKKNANESNLRIERRITLDPGIDPPKVDIIWMAVPFSNLDKSKSNTKDYWANEIDPSSRKYKGNAIPKSHLAKEVCLSFYIDTDTVDLRFDADPTKTATFKTDFGSIDIDFNNDCGDDCKGNDFRHVYYAVIDDATGHERQFLAGKVPRPTSEYVSFVDGPKQKSILNQKVQKDILSSMGNCDPIGSEPPPQGDWPPIDPIK